ncbi:MAG TPA: hypothetical protein DIW77_08790 [Chromatiaceae bacterium]|nr:hypothetical protein [Chromatiaceae bacterium]
MHSLGETAKGFKPCAQDAAPRGRKDAFSIGIGIEHAASTNLRFWARDANFATDTDSDTE